LGLEVLEPPSQRYIFIRIKSTVLSKCRVLECLWTRYYWILTFHSLKISIILPCIFFFDVAKFEKICQL